LFFIQPYANCACKTSMLQLEEECQMETILSLISLLDFITILFTLLFKY
jgi:hypothetical protein